VTRSRTVLPCAPSGCSTPPISEDRTGCSAVFRYSARAEVTHRLLLRVLDDVATGAVRDETPMADSDAGESRQAQTAC
jgi:hypothetical protein